MKSFAVAALCGLALAPFTAAAGHEHGRQAAHLRLDRRDGLAAAGRRFQRRAASGKRQLDGVGAALDGVFGAPTAATPAATPAPAATTEAAVAVVAPVTTATRTTTAMPTASTFVAVNPGPSVFTGVAYNGVANLNVNALTVKYVCLGAGRYYWFNNYGIALPQGFIGDYSTPSSLCGTLVAVTNPANGRTIVATVVDASGDPTVSMLNEDAFSALSDGTADFGITFVFLPPTEAQSVISANQPGSVIDAGLAATYTSHAVVASQWYASVASVSSAEAAAASAAAASSAAADAAASSSAAAAAAASSAAAASAAEVASSSSVAAAAAASSASVRSARLAAASSSSEAAAAAASASAAAEAAASSRAARAAASSSAEAAAAAASQQAAAAASRASATYSGYATYYLQNGVAGHCGTVAREGDYVIAIDSRMWNGGANCDRRVRLTRTDNGNSVTATIRDECPTCVSSGSLDLSIGAFIDSGFATAAEGMVPMTWTFL